MERYQFESSVEEARVDKEVLMDQYNQLDNPYSYSLDQINNLTNENTQLVKKQDLLSNEVSRLFYSLIKTNLGMETLSDENKTLSQEKRVYLNNMSISSQQLNILQKVCVDQEKSLRSLRNELKEVTESSIAERDTLIQGRIALSVKANQLKDQYSKLEESYSSLAKKNAFLISKEKNLQSRLTGLVGDKFDDAMDRWENSCLSLIQHLISQKEESEKNLHSSISVLEAKYAKIRKENALLVSVLTGSRDRAERRLDYLAYFKDIQDRNHQRALLRQVHLRAEVLLNDILLSNSLPSTSIDPLEVDDDEVPRPADSDYDYESGAEDNFLENEEEVPSKEASAGVNQNDKEISPEEVVAGNIQDANQVIAGDNQNASHDEDQSRNEGEACENVGEELLSSPATDIDIEA